MSAYNSSRQHRRARYSAPKQSYKRASRSQAPVKGYIHPSKFVRAAEPQNQELYQPRHSFDDFELSPLLKANLAAKGFELPLPIQDQTIPVALDGHDVIGVANTGTGKTAAFALPILHRLLTNPHSKALILAPTRELAQQIEQECRTIVRGSGLFGALLIGGASIGLQLRDLRANPNVVIGTPGRVRDHLERGTLRLQQFDMVVLDEVDRMLDMGFVNDVRTILSQLKQERQSFFFSATLGNNVSQLIETFANDPVTVSVKTADTSDNVNQDIVRYNGKTEKIDKLHDLLVQKDVQKTIVFEETQRNVDRLGKELSSRGFSADTIHGGKSQGQRQRALQRFKDSNVDILIATDVAARGIDIADITHVINYSIPQTYEDYTHRIGRAGRAGKIGYALTFVAQ